MGDKNNITFCDMQLFEKKTSNLYTIANYLINYIHCLNNK